MSQRRSRNSTPNSGQDALQGDSFCLTNLDEWRYTHMYPNNSGYRPTAQQVVTPVSNLYHHNGTHHPTIGASRLNMQFEEQQVSHQNQYLPEHQRANHQQFQRRLHQRSSRMVEQTHLRAIERECNTNVFQLQLEENTLHPIPNTSSLMTYNNSFQFLTAGMEEQGRNDGNYFQTADKVVYEERKKSENKSLDMKVHIDSLRKIWSGHLGEREKFKSDIKALVNEKRRLKAELLESQNMLDESERCFNDMYGEKTQELQVMKAKSEEKSRCLENMKLQMQRKDAELEKVQNKLREIRKEMRESKKVLKKLRETVISRDIEITELKRENSNLKSHVTNYEKECKKLKEHVAELECDVAIEIERKEKMKEYCVKLTDRYLKKQVKEMKRFIESKSNLSKGVKRSVERDSTERECSSGKMRKQKGNYMEVDQELGAGGGAMSEKQKRIKMKKEKWNIKNYLLVSDKSNCCDQNKSNSTKGGVGVGIDKMKDTFYKGTGKDKNGDGLKKRVCSIAKTRLPQWKHLRETGTFLVMAGQKGKQLCSDFRKK